MLARLRALFARPSALARAEAEAVARLDCQRVHAARSLKAKATINGLKAAVDEATRARFEERVQTVLKMRGSA